MLKATLRKTLIFVSISALTLAFSGFVFSLAAPQEARAQTEYNSLIYYPQVQIPIAGSGFEKDSVKVGEYKETTGKMTSDLLARYIKVIYDYGMSIAGILAAIVLMGGGILWLVSGGNDSRIAQAKEMIIGSISGLAILFCSWLLLHTINPELLKLRVISTQVVKKADYFCCQYKDPLSLSPGGIRAAMIADGECVNKGGTVFKPQVNVFGQARNYNTDSKGEKCVLPGCCIHRQNGDPAGRIIKCSNSFYDNCKNAFFMETECQFVTEEWDANGNVSSCKGTAVDNCATAEDGDDCYDDQTDDSACYDGVCWIGDGKTGEPCGNELYSKCDADEDGACDGDSIGGRDCGPDLSCCRFTSGGKRIDN